MIYEMFKFKGKEMNSIVKMESAWIKIQKTFSAIFSKWKARIWNCLLATCSKCHQIYYSCMTYELLNGNRREKYLKLSKYAYGQKRLKVDEMTIFFIPIQYTIFAFKI